ncbi:lipoyltransferase 1, mitochondrial isoform X1 [Thalassophryne amazonica]|uniref:lipoyltransferase 1, mitochondrial isoform X1 n=1 Tax=Thalassophryne amazonica TaxID=390379 RepID=UPI001471465F|nr:lipoyltransferase 1, mitochondrial isoform X1 [Thalassophryne amazonica]
MASHIRRTPSFFRYWTCKTGFQLVRCSSSLLQTFEQGSGQTGLILQSLSTDIHQNLALEDWIDTNVNLQQMSVLLLWKNQPAVVIGRHQNPWIECNLPAMRRSGILLARRRSGGGTVFHDLGNLNMTFFTSKKGYNRHRNLRVITDALGHLYPGLDVHATDRCDILLNGHYKISGSASRLSRNSSYHHCTLLYSADCSTLKAVLRSSTPGIHSNATPSISSPVANLIDHTPLLQWEELLNALVAQYNTEFGFSAPVTSIDPTNEVVFPGVTATVAELRGWEWTFGKTPKFSIQTVLDLTDCERSVRSSAHLHMEVKNGLIGSCLLDVPTDWLPDWLSRELSGVLVGGRFCSQDVAAAIAVLLRTQSGVLRTRLHILCDAVAAVM